MKTFRSITLGVIAGAVLAIGGSAIAANVVKRIQGTLVVDKLTVNESITAETEITSSTLITADNYRVGSGGGPSDYIAAADINKATLQAKHLFMVDTGAGALDLDFGDDAALDAADIGSRWLFCVGIGGTNALTVTAGASGVTTMKLVDADGTTCEDVGDCIEVIAYATTAATAFTRCAD